MVNSKIQVLLFPLNMVYKKKKKFFHNTDLGHSDCKIMSTVMTVHGIISTS